MRIDSLPGPVVETAADIVRRRTGLTFSSSRLPAFETALAAALRRAETGPQAYLSALENQASVMDELIADITVGETYFFRDPGQFEVLRNDIVPSLETALPPGRPLRVWSAGCASGEEAYSASIVLSSVAGREVHVLGTDISRRALARAVAGRYGRWSLRNTTPAETAAWFESHDRDFVVRPSARRNVEFRYLNLADDTYPSMAAGVWGMDVILCRNVLIYLAQDVVRAIAQRLLASLSDHGWLMLGASDPMLSDLVRCEVRVTAAGLVYRRLRRGERRVRPRAHFGLTFTPSPAWHPEPRLPQPEPPPAPAPSHPPAPEPGLPRSTAAGGPAAPATDPVREDEVRSAVERVRALANRGELAAADQACIAALERDETCAELHYLHAVLLGEAGHSRESADAARRALYLDRTLVVARLALAGALARLGEIDGACRVLASAVDSLAEMPADATIPASDGEPAGRLLQMARIQGDLLRARER